MNLANCGGLLIDNDTIKMNENKEIYATGASAEIGELTSLTTTEKTTLVGAINELVTRIATLENA